MLSVNQKVMRYNLAAHNSNVRVIARFIHDRFGDEAGALFIELAGEFSSFPYISIGDILISCTRSGASCTAKHAGLDELMSLRSSALIFINRRTDLPYSLEVVRLDYIHGDHFVVVDEFNDPLIISFNDMRTIFSGVVILANTFSEELYKNIMPKSPFNLHRSLISPHDCQKIISRCEMLGFTDIPNSNFQLDNLNDIDGDSRIGMRLDIHSTEKFLRNFVDTAIAQIGLKSGLVCEAAECFKVATHCKAYRRFDNGVNLRRRMSVHIAVGHHQRDINLRFTECRNEQVLKIGDAVSIETCDSDGRTNWRSEWSLLPPQSGEIYLISCWFIDSQPDNNFTAFPAQSAS